MRVYGREGGVGQGSAGRGDEGTERSPSTVPETGAPGGWPRRPAWAETLPSTIAASFYFRRAEKQKAPPFKSERNGNHFQTVPPVGNSRRSSQHRGPSSGGPPSLQRPLARFMHAYRRETGFATGIGSAMPSTSTSGAWTSIPARYVRPTRDPEAPFSDFHVHSQWELARVNDLRLLHRQRAPRSVEKGSDLNGHSRSISPKASAASSLTVASLSVIALLKARTSGLAYSPSLPRAQAAALRTPTSSCSTR